MKNVGRQGHTAIEGVFGLLIFLLIAAGSLEMLNFTAVGTTQTRVSLLRDNLVSEIHGDLIVPAFLAATMNHAENTTLLQCVTGKTAGAVVENGCTGNTSVPVTIATNNVVAAGNGQASYPVLYAMNGKPCPTGAATGCPLRATATYSAYCTNGVATCTRADKISLSFTVDLNPTFQKITVRTVSEKVTFDAGAFSGARCPYGRISRGYLPNGLVDCWTWQIGSSKPSAAGATYRDDQGLAIDVDTSGNIYYAGQTYGSFGTATNSGNDDVVVSMMDSHANAQWVNQFSLGATSNIGSIAFNLADNSIYLTGQGTYTGAHGKGNSGKSDAFVMKLDNQGNIQWSYSLGTKMGSSGKALAFDSVGNTICTWTAGVNKSGNTAYGLASFNVGKFDKSGNQLWANTTLGTSKDSSRLARARVDLNDKVYLLGSTGDANNPSLTDLYLAKLNSDGSLNQSVTYSYTNNDEWPVDLIVDTSGNVLVGEQTRTSSSATWNIVLLKFSAADITLPPTTTLISFPGNNTLSKMSTDSAGNYYLAVNTDGAITGFQNQGLQDVYLMMLDSNLNVKWSRQMGTTGTDSVSDMVAKSIGGQVFTFIIGSTDNMFSGWLNMAPTRDIFFAKFDNKGR